MTPCVVGTSLPIRGLAELEPHTVVDTLEVSLLSGVASGLTELEKVGTWAEQAVPEATDKPSERTLLAEAGTSSGQMLVG